MWLVLLREECSHDLLDHKRHVGLSGWRASHSVRPRWMGCHTGGRSVLVSSPDACSRMACRDCGTVDWRDACFVRVKVLQVTGLRHIASYSPFARPQGIRTQACLQPLLGTTLWIKCLVPWCTIVVFIGRSLRTGLVSCRRPGWIRDAASRMHRRRNAMT